MWIENLELLERGDLKVGSANPEEEETEDAEDTEEVIINVSLMVLMSWNHYLYHRQFESISY